MAYSSYKKQSGKGGYKSAPVYDSSFEGKNFEKTEYHIQIENSVKSGQNTFIDAGPGSGKTTTIFRVILPGIMQSKGNKKGIIFAFNKKNATDFQTKIKPEYTGVKAGTIHAILYGILKANNPYIRVNAPQKAGEYKGRYQREKDGKTKEMVKAIFPDENGNFIGNVCRLISLAKNNAFGLPGYSEIFDRPAWEELIQKYGISDGLNIDFEGESEGPDLIESAQKAFIETVKNKAEIDYDDMVYFPLYYGAKLPELDFIILDEAQDIFPVTLEFISRVQMENNSLQIVMVGDRKQAINSFAGSMDNAIDICMDKLGGVSLQMPVSYRCSIAAANKANEIFPDSVIPSENANLGDILQIDFAEFSDSINEMDENDAVLSRTHKNLIPFAMGFIKAGRKFVYKGIRDWANKANRSLYHAAKMGGNLTEIRQALNEYQSEIEDKYLGRPTPPKWVIESGETIDALCLLIAGIEAENGDLKDVKKYIKALIESDNDNRDCVVLSTIHASKGGEWENVYIIGDCISPLAKTESELAAEKCCQFVAYTRSSDKLIFVPAGK